MVRTKNHFSVVTGVLILAVFSSLMAVGATLSVPDQIPSIKEAMIKAQSGDIILVSCGVYHEHDILVKPGVSLWSGTLQPSCVTIDAGNLGRCLIFDDADSNTSVVGFTITGGQANPEDHLGQGGGILVLNSSPKISNCIIQSNTAEVGGGIFVDEYSQLNMDNCQINNNQASQTGGGLAFHGTKGLVNGCLFEENLALCGAGVSLKGTTEMIIDNTQLTGNTAGNSGGGILLRDSTCTMDGTVFSGNIGGLGGGGLAAFNSNPKLSHCTFYGNDSEKEGCALACADSKVEINDSQLTFHPGPLMCQLGSTPILSGCNVFGNDGGDWLGILADQAYKRRNISEDPLFCGAKSGNFHLSSTSASLPDNNPAGNKKIIGAFGIGCSMVAKNEYPANRLADGGL